MSATTVTEPGPYVEIGRIDYDAGSVGGDYQASPSASRRFTRSNDDGTFSTVDIYAFVTDEYRSKDRAKEDRFWDYVVMTMSSTHTDREDVGGTEFASDVEYETPSLNGFDRKRAALTAARDYIRSIELGRDL